ncbi:MAG: hypothetical protein ACR2IV_23805 [Bryobacteraceae bacterium]
MLPIEYFDHFRAELFALPVKPHGYTREELINKRFHDFSDCGLDVYYAPFHYLNKNARVLLMGLTPGWTQMEKAFRAARLGIAQGLDGEALFHHIDMTACFGGGLMRNNLISMLNEIGLHRCLKIGSCADLFDLQKPGPPLAGFTSAVSAPIFRKGSNYRGYGPQLLQVPRLKQWVLENLAKEFASVHEAVIVPLGTVANEVIQFLHGHEPPLIRPDRCFTGFPHPSGANGHRKPVFERGRERWREQLARWFQNPTDYK